MAEPAPKTSQNVSTIQGAMPKLQVKVHIFQLDAKRDQFKKKSDNSFYYKQPASISQGKDLPTIPHSFYVQNPDDQYEPGEYLCDVQIKSGKFGAEFELGKPQPIKQPG